MEDLKMVCPKCKAQLDFCGCPTCLDDGYVTPPKEILDAIECDRIERKLLSDGRYHITVSSFIYENILYPAIIIADVGLGILFSYHSKDGATKLETLQKAEEWLNKRGESK